MTQTFSHSRNAVAVLLFAAAVGLSGCAVTIPIGTSQQGTMGSRAVIYESLDQLVADSAIIVVGTVAEQTTATADAGGDSSQYTVSSFRVEESFAPSGMASSLADSGVKPSSPSAGDVVVIRQFGTPGTITTAGPLLQSNERYLLFLNPTMLPGSAADEYFIVGSEAGIYQANDDQFARLVHGGDSIPEILNPAENLG